MSAEYNYDPSIQKSYNGPMVEQDTKACEFASLVSSLRSEVATSTELANETRRYANNLKSMNEIEPDGSKPQLPAQGIVGILWEEITRLREANAQAQRNLCHLRDLIGS